MPLFSFHLRVLRAFVVSFSLCLFSSHAAIFFHSDFENNQSFTAAEIEPGATKIKLLPSYEIDEWFPLTGGKAILEPNHPENREEIRYAERRGNTLWGVDGIAKPHARHVALRTDGLTEWFDQARRQRHYTQNKVVASDKAPLAGSYSAHIQTGANTFAFLFRDIPFPQSNQYNIRFLMRLSTDFVDNLMLDFPLLHAHFGKIASLRLTIVRAGSNGAIRLALKETPTAKVIHATSPDTIRLLPNLDYCVEMATELLGDDTAQSNIMINDVLVETVLSRHAPPGNSPPNIRIGKIGETPCTGSLWLDGIAASDKRIGPIPARPFVRFADGRLVGLAGQSQGEANPPHGVQWQFAAENSWLLPQFDTGERDSSLMTFRNFGHTELTPSLFEHLRFHETIRTPILLPKKQPVLVRTRHMNQHSNWSQWSAPERITIPETREETDTTPLRVRGAYFTKVGSRRRIRNLQKGQWYDLHLHFTPVLDTSFLDVYLSGNLDGNTANHFNRGGAFRARDNYLLSFSFPERGIWVKQVEGEDGSTCILGEKGLFCNDSKDVSVFDQKRGRARARIRLLETAVPGTWRLSTFIAESHNGISPFFRQLFTVAGSEEVSPHGQRKLAVWVLVGILLFLILLFRLLRRERQSVRDSQTTERPADAPFQDDRAKKADEYIQTNYGRPISLQDVAQAMNVSTDWLGKFFKRETGKTVLQRINEIRVEKAKELLRETNLAVNDIAFRVGFNSMQNFNPTFRKIAGCSPLSYRKDAGNQSSSQ